MWWNIGVCWREKGKMGRDDVGSGWKREGKRRQHSGVLLEAEYQPLRAGNSIDNPWNRPRFLTPETWALLYSEFDCDDRLAARSL